MKELTIHRAKFDPEFDLSAAALNQALQRLPGESFGKSVLRYNKTDHRWMSLLGRQALLRGLKQINVLLPPGAEWQVDNNGRPYVKGCPDFNISHSGKIAVCAIASGRERVGVDVQAEKPMGDRQLRQVLTPRELAWVNGDPRRVAFLWSRKEAVSKLLGLGMRISYRTLETLNNRVSFKGRTFYLTPVPIGRGYQCTVAAESPLTVSVFRYRWLSPDRLVASPSTPQSRTL